MEIDFDVIRTRNLQRIEPYGYIFVFFSFQQPFFVFYICWFNLEMKYFYLKNKSRESFQAFSETFLKKTTNF